MVNCAVIMGRLVANPELRATRNSGVSVTSITVAVDRKFSGEDKQADFIDVIAWRGTAEFICKYFRKGSMIAIQGYIQTRMYEDKNGNKRKAVEIVAGRCETESSGGITYETMLPYAQAGVDYISFGALTHSVKGMDMSFKAC